MMASSQDKAIALKDSYVDTLLKGGVTAPIQGMPEVDMGNTASMIVNLDTGMISAHNDGDPHNYVGRKGTTVRSYMPEARYPLPSKGPGFSTNMQMNYDQHRNFTRTFEGQVELDRQRRMKGFAEHPHVKVFQNRSGY